MAGECVDALLVDLGRTAPSGTTTASTKAWSGRRSRRTRIRARNTCRSSSISSRDTPGATPRPIQTRSRPCRVGAIVVHDAPRATGGARPAPAVREDRRVLTGDRALVRQPIGHPSLELTLRQAAGVHQLMKWMLGVRRAAERAKAAGSASGDSGRRGPGWAVGAEWPAGRTIEVHTTCSRFYRLKPMPSTPTRVPAARPAAVRVESPTNIGFVLLMCVVDSAPAWRAPPAGPGCRRDPTPAVVHLRSFARRCRG